MKGEKRMHTYQQDHTLNKEEEQRAKHSQNYNDGSQHYCCRFNKNTIKVHLEEKYITM